MAPTTRASAEVVADNQDISMANDNATHSIDSHSRSCSPVNRSETTTSPSPQENINTNYNVPNDHHNGNFTHCPEAAGPAHSLNHRNRHGWRRIVLNFTPSWFSVNMGTGIVSILLNRLPYNATWLYYISVAVFVLNIALFLLFLGITVLRYAMFRGLWSVMIQHPVQSLFLGTFPMGLATIINMIVFVCVPAWGQRFAMLAWGLWWVDVVLAISTNFYLPFIIMYKHEVRHPFLPLGHLEETKAMEKLT